MNIRTIVYHQIKKTPGRAGQIVVFLEPPEQRNLEIDLGQRYILQLDVVLDPEAEPELELKPIRLLSNSFQCISLMAVCKYRFWIEPHKISD